MRIRFMAVIGSVALSISLGACHPKPPLKPSDQGMVPPTTSDAEPSLRNKFFQEVPQIAMVHFDFNSIELRADAREILKKNSDVLEAHPDWSVLVEGHCDERGTTAYNLGLGQRRAEAVRKYYEALGLSGGRVATLSYGKEKPLCNESTEACWAQNRRAVTKVALKPESPDKL